jgi:O-antigen/teichoic acid export membrane protein
MALARRLITNTGYLVFGDALSSVLQFVFVLFMGKAFGEAGVGKYSFALSFVMVFVVFADLGIGTYLIREVSRNKQNRTIVARALIVRLIATGFFCFLLLLFIWALQDIFTGEKILLISLIAVYQIFFGIADIFVAEFKGHEKMGYAAALSLFLKVIVVGLGIALIFFGFSLTRVLSVLPVGAFIYLILTLVLSMYKFGIPPLTFKAGKELVSLFKDILPFGITIVLMELLGRQEILILSFLKGDSAAGIYTIGLKIATFILGFAILIQVSILPTLSTYFLKSKERLVEVSCKILKYLLIAGLPVSFAFFCLAERIIGFLYKDLFYESIIVLKITGWLVSLGLVLALFSSLLTAINRQGFKAYTAGISLSLSLILNIILVPHFSYIGAAIVRLTVEFNALLLYVYFTWRFLAYIPIIQYAFKPLVASSFMALFIYWANNINLLFVIPLAALTYLISLTLIKGLRREDLTMIKRAVFGDDKQETVNA